MTELSLNKRPPIIDHGDWLLNRDYDASDMENLFYETGAPAWISLIRAEYSDGTIDMESTAANLGVPLTFTGELPFRQMGGTAGLESKRVEDIAILLNSDHDRHIPLTFGHEVGHIFLSTVLGQEPHVWDHHDVIEQFCEYFGYQMVIPDRDVEPVETVNESLLKEFTQRYQIEIEPVIRRLILAGKLPKKVAVDSKFPKSENPNFSEKISRNYVCLDCINNLPCQNFGDDIEVFKFLDETWWGSISGCHKEPNYFRDKDLLRKLNEHYSEPPQEYTP